MPRANATLLVLILHFTSAAISSSLKRNRAGEPVNPTMSIKKITVCGWTGCGFFQKAWNVTNAIGIMHPNRVQAVKIELATRDDYKVHASSSFFCLSPPFWLARFIDLFLLSTRLAHACHIVGMARQREAQAEPHRRRDPHQLAPYMDQRQRVPGRL
jgi:hypothetical protein